MVEPVPTFLSDWFAVSGGYADEDQERRWRMFQADLRQILEDDPDLAARIEEEMRRW